MRTLAILALTLVVPSVLIAQAPQISDSAGVRVVTNATPGASAPAFRLSAKPRAAIGVVEGAPAYTLSGIHSGTLLSDGTIVLVDGGTKEIRFYDGNGKYLRSAGREGEGPGEFRSPQLVGLLPGDSLVVDDGVQKRVSILSPDGRYARSVPVRLQLFYASHGMLADGRVVVSQTSIARVDHPTVFRDTIPEVWLSLRDGSTQPFATLPGDQVFKLGTGLNAGTLVFGRGLHVDARGNRIAVANDDAYSIRIYDGSGRIVQVVRESGREPVKARPGEWEDAVPPAFRAGAPRANSAPFGLAYQKQPHLDTKPPWGGFCFISCLRLDQAGNLWVAEYRAITYAEVELESWHVFDSNGVFVGRITLPAKAKLMDAGRDWILLRQRDDLDVDHVVLYGLERMAGK